MTANRMIYIFIKKIKKPTPPEWRQTVWFFSWCPFRTQCVLTPYVRTRRAHPRKPRALADAAVAAVVGGEAADPV